jgi:serine/threonine protein phosphatase PrpC
MPAAIFPNLEKTGQVLAICRQNWRKPAAYKVKTHHSPCFARQFRRALLPEMGEQNERRSWIRACSAVMACFHDSLLNMTSHI